MSIYKDQPSVVADPSQGLEKEDDRTFFDPLVDFGIGAAKGVAGAVEGTLELATLFQADLPTNLGLGEAEGFAQGLGSFASNIATAYLTGGAALAGASKVAGQVGRMPRYLRAASMFKGAAPESAASLATAIIGRSKAVGTFIQGEARFALGEFITVTGERGLDAVSLLGLDDTDLGAHFAINDGKSEFESRLISSLNGLGLAAGLTTAGRGAKAIKKGLTRSEKAVGPEAKILQDIAEDEGGIELKGSMTREEMVAVGRAAGIDFDSTGSFSQLTRNDLEQTAEKLRAVRAKRIDTDSEIEKLANSADPKSAQKRSELIDQRRAYIDEESTLAGGLGPEYEALAKGDRNGYLKSIAGPIGESVQKLYDKLLDKPRGKKLVEDGRFEQVYNLLNGAVRGERLRLGDKVDYLQVLNPTESNRLVQAIALSGTAGKGTNSLTMVDLPGDLGDLIDTFAERQVRAVIGDGASKIDVMHAQSTYRQHMANLLSDIKPKNTSKGLNLGETARNNLLALERIEMIHGMYKAMQGEFFLDDAMASRRIFGQRLAGFTNEQARDSWSEVPKAMKRKVENLQRYTKEIQKARPDADEGRVMAAILRLNDGTLGQKYRELKIATIMASPTLQSANISSAALRNIEEFTSEYVGGRLIRMTRKAEIENVSESVLTAIKNGRKLNGLQLASIQRVNFSLTNMQQWFRSIRASGAAQGRTTTGSRISPSMIGSEEVSLNPSAFGLDPRVEAKVNFGARLASAADDATKASAVAQTTTNNIFNTLLHAAPDEIEAITQRAHAFQDIFHDGINAAIRKGETIEQGRLLEILEEAAQVSGTTNELRRVLTEKVGLEKAANVDQFINESFLDLSERSLLASQHRTFTNLRATGFEKDITKRGGTESIANTQGQGWGMAVQAVRGLAELMPDGVRALVLPFLNTPVNVFLYGLDFTPLSKSFWDGLYTAAGGANGLGGQVPGLRAATDLLAQGDLNAARKVGRAVTGITMGSGLAAAHFSGVIKVNGAGPRDPQNRKAWLNDGRQPYSIEVAGQSISFDRMGTMALPFRFAADLIDVADNPYGLEQTDEIISGLIVAHAETMLSGLLMEQTAALFEAVTSGNTKRLAQILGQEAAYVGLPAAAGVAGLAAGAGAASTIGAGVVGASTSSTLVQAGIRIGNTESPPTRDQSFTEALKSSFFDRYKAYGNDKARNILGEPIKRRNSTQEAAGALLGLARISTPKNDTLDVELAALNYPIAPPSTNIQGLNLLDPAYGLGGRSAYDRYAELVGKVEIGGKTYEQALMDTIRSVRYRRMPREGVTAAGLASPRHEALAEVTAKYRSKAQQQLARERPRFAEDVRQRKIAQTALTYGQSPESIMSRFFPDLR